jgi:hypothetical protein
MSPRDREESKGRRDHRELEGSVASKVHAVRRDHAEPRDRRDRLGRREADVRADSPPAGS